MARAVPDWFPLSEQVMPKIMERIDRSVNDLSHISIQVRMAPMLALWFLRDTLALVDQTNRDGMHANSLALTRQCVETMGVIELGVCRHADAEAKLLQWEEDKLTPGKLRAWLESNVWARYGVGLWSEPWSTFMGEFARAVQPYAHYSRGLAQWQVRLVGFSEETDSLSPGTIGLIEAKPRAYDPQKATRITLFMAIQLYVLGRMWIAANSEDKEFAELIERLRSALGRSRYLDGHETDWSQQFWAMLWERGGRTVLE